MPLRDIVRDVLPFLWAMIAALALITFFPELVLWLPRLLRLPGLIAMDDESRSSSSTARTSTGSASASRRSTARRRWPRSRRCAARRPATRPLRFHQSNSEAEIIDWIHEAIDEGAGIVINPAGFTFTSIAILDALKMFSGPIIELHISNIHRREANYHHSLVSKVATAVIAGLGRAAMPSRFVRSRDLIAAVSGART